MLVHAGDDDNPARFDFVKQAVRKALDSGASESGMSLDASGNLATRCTAASTARMNS